MKNQPQKWEASKGHPQKQSNFGRYKTSVTTGEGMQFKAVLIMADDPADAMEVAHLAASASDMLEALKGVIRVADRKTVEFDAAHAAIAKATS